MDWLALQNRYSRDNDLPPRAARIDALTRVLFGTMYAALDHSFSTERSPAGEYVPLDNRRPSVRSNLCRTVVDDSVSLLFGEGHFPAVIADDPSTRSQIVDLIRESDLPEIMLDAATRGSVGSVCIQFQVINRRPSFTVIPTINLTPTWAVGQPRVLERVTQRYKVRGDALASQGYAIAPNDYSLQFWFQREWDDTDETWFVPQTVDDAKAGKLPPIDTKRSLRHGLGFVPMVWIRNLPGGDTTDGACTFEAAIDTVIEIDYLLSQGGRGLKYASDPVLVIKAGQDGQGHAGGSAQALNLPPDADAKLLEINGAAASVVLEQVRYLRSLALEAIHGNRADSDRLTAAQSGKSQELMNLALCQLTGRLRLSYGESGLLGLLRMVCSASQQVEGGLLVGDVDGMTLDATGLELRWPTYFQPTNNDLLQNAQALVTALDGGIVSQETAVTKYAAMTDVDDAQEELARIQGEKAAAQAQALQIAQASTLTTDPQAVRQDANTAKTETRQVTA